MSKGRAAGAVEEWRCSTDFRGRTHHRQCEDIGTVKLPRWIREYTGKGTVSIYKRRHIPADLSPYALIVHCGGCMLNENAAPTFHSEKAGREMTNYGICIAYIHGILEKPCAFKL